MRDHSQAFKGQTHKSYHRDKNKSPAVSFKQTSLTVSKPSSKTESVYSSSSATTKDTLSVPAPEKQRSSQERVKSWLSTSRTYEFGARHNTIDAKTKRVVLELRRATEGSGRSRRGAVQPSRDHEEELKGDLLKVGAWTRTKDDNQGRGRYQ